MADRQHPRQHPGPGARGEGAGRLAASLVFDMALPAAIYYGARAIGAGQVAALIWAAVTPTGYVLVQVLRFRRIDAIGLAVLAILALSLGATLLGGGPRPLLARGAWVTALLALGMLCTLLWSRPFTYHVLKALLPAREARIEAVWRSNPRFRRVWRGLAALWAGGLLMDAGTRAWMAYALPVDVVPALDAVLYAVTFLGLQALTHLWLHTSGMLRILFWDDDPAD